MADKILNEIDCLKLQHCKAYNGNICIRINDVNLRAWTAPTHTVLPLEEFSSGHGLLDTVKLAVEFLHGAGVEINNGDVFVLYESPKSEDAMYVTLAPENSIIPKGYTYIKNVIDNRLLVLCP